MVNKLSEYGKRWKTFYPQRCESFKLHHVTVTIDSVLLGNANTMKDLKNDVVMLPHVLARKIMMS